MRTCRIWCVLVYALPFATSRAIQSEAVQNCLEQRAKMCSKYNGNVQDREECLPWVQT